MTAGTSRSSSGERADFPHSFGPDQRNGIHNCRLADHQAPANDRILRLREIRGEIGLSNHGRANSDKEDLRFSLNEDYTARRRRSNESGWIPSGRKQVVPLSKDIEGVMPRGNNRPELIPP